MLCSCTTKSSRSLLPELTFWTDQDKQMTPVIEALLVAFLAGTVASVVSGYINRGIARVKRRRKLKKRPPAGNGESS